MQADRPPTFIFNGLCAGIILLGAVCVRADVPATQPGHAYFPTAFGTTWKYLVTPGAAEKPYVQTITAGRPVNAGGQIMFPLDGDLYLVKSDSVHLFGHRDGTKAVPLAEPLKILPAKPRSGEAWGSSKGDSTYSTCLGSQVIKTEAGEFTTQCVFVTSNPDAATQRQIYRYYARQVGLVRETISEKSTRPDGTANVREITRDLVAFTPAAVMQPATALKPPDPIGTDALKGELLDPVGQPIAQATLTLRRLDKPDSQQIQTDVTGRFSAAGLDPAGSYILAAHLIGYEKAEVPLRSDDRKPVLAAVKLKPAAAEEDKSDPFVAGKRLAAAGDHRGALAKYSEALATDPKNTAIHAYKAMSQLALGQPKEAQQTVDAAMKLNDQDVLLWEVSGQLQVAENQPTKARTLFDKAAQLSPKTAGNMYMDLAAALAGRNEPRLSGEIDSALKAAAAAEPPSSEALFQLGQGYANAGKPEGRAFLKKYLDVATKLPDADQDKQKIQVAKQLIRALDILNASK